MIRQGKTILFALIALALVFPLHGANVPTSFAATHYYILSLGEMPVDLSALIQTTQSAGYSIIQYDGDTATVYRGGEAVDMDATTVLADEYVLLVDGSRFYLREIGEAYAFTVRPAEVGYELVINPQQELSINDTLASILTALQQIGILGNEVNLEFASFAKADLKGPAAPTGVFIESTLYGLMVAEDWFVYAAAKGFTQVGLRVEIVAEKVPGGVLDAEFIDYVVEETESLVKLLLPIDKLLVLAKSSSIGYVRIAYQPAVP
ncbi:hypothetical protein KAR02_08430 [Candidatus Bipolaricaulota bacterium]|nr:hypothetical protein [Candidatus Bipolaricaulota bacterium]